MTMMATRCRVAIFVSYALLVAFRPLSPEPGAPRTARTGFAGTGRTRTVELYHKEVTGRILACFFRVHRQLGHGHLESVYERAMEIALREAGLSVQRQVPVQVYFQGVEVGHFHADMLVEGCILLELKAAAAISGAHEAQTLNYLCASKLEIGFVLNFGVRPEFRRFAGPEARRRRR